MMACRRQPGALWFGGDVHLGASTRADLSAIREMVGPAAGVVNLEGPVLEGAGYAHIDGKTVRLGNPASTGALLRGAGVAVASVMNNHRADGDTGATVARLEAAGLAVAGPAPATLSVGGARVVVFAHDLDDPGTPEAVARELAQADGLRVESFHVSGPPSYLPTPALVAAVDAAVAARADVVVAHGTHVIGPVERREGTVIAWGLGNLLFDCACTREDEALVLRVSLAPGHPAEIFPVRAGLDGAPAAASPDAEGVLDLVAALSGAALLRQPGRAGF